jgi:translation initiation factor IF-1
MAKEEAISLTGRVTEALANTQFRVKLHEVETEIICTIGGRLRKNFIKIIPGDEVTIEMSPYDLTKGRIVYRGKQSK